MKIFLTKSDNSNIHGYTKITSMHALESSCYNSQAVEIYAPTFLSNIELNLYSSFFSLCNKKLKNTGKLIVGGINLIKLNNAIKYRTMSLSDINRILFNDKVKSACYCETVISLLTTSGFVIESVEFDEFTDLSYVITAQKALTHYE